MAQLKLSPNAEYLLDGVLVTAGNAAAVASVIMFSRAWKLAGIELPGPKWIQWSVTAFASLLAIVIVGAGSIEIIPRLATGELIWLASLASIAGDLICLSLIAPLFLTALALRGGLFMRPWIFLTASMLAWLFYDAAYTAPLMGLNQKSADLFIAFFRSLAHTLVFSAGMAQRSILGGLQRKQKSGNHVSIQSISVS